MDLCTPERDVTIDKSLLLYKGIWLGAIYPTEESQIWHKDIHAVQV
jgi:hypothetical protein